MKHAWMGVALMLGASAGVGMAASEVQFDGNVLTLRAENQTLGSVLDLMRQQAGFDYELPAELRGLMLPLVEVRGLSAREAVLRVLEGCHCDFILMGSPERPDRVEKLVVMGKSTKVMAAAASPSRPAGAPAMEDAFGGDQAAEDFQAIQPVPPDGPQPGGQTQPAPNPFGLQPGQPNQPGAASPLPAPQQGQPQTAQPLPYQPQQPPRDPYNRQPF